MRKDQSCKLQSSAASRKRAKSSTELATEVTETGSRKKKSASSITVLRWSRRIQNAVSSTQDKDIEPVVETTQDKDIEPVIETIDLHGNDEQDHQDEEQNHSYEEKKRQKKDYDIWNLEGKIDYLTLLLEAQEKIHESKSMGAQNLCFADTKSQMKKDKYKLMYIDSQKKIERMQEENHQLAVKLENALGKIEAYEKGQSIFSDTIERLKDAMLISTITKTTEMMFGLSSPRANNGDCAGPTVAKAKAPVAKAKAPVAKKRKYARRN